MRLWHYKILPYLPDLQFKGQLRELIAIMRDWKVKGKTNHLLINRVMEYPKSQLFKYFIKYSNEYNKKYHKTVSEKYLKEFLDFEDSNEDCFKLFEGWHDKEYLRVNMANLYEKYKYGIGKSKISEEEWNKLLVGYKNITGEDYYI